MTKTKAIILAIIFAVIAAITLFLDNPFDRLFIIIVSTFALLLAAITQNN